MDKLFDQLSDIENSASGIMEEANRRKAAFAREGIEVRNFAHT